jgi:hypothetical protein
MASSRFRGGVGFLVAGSMVFCSTAAAASAPVPQQAAPWAALIALAGGAPAEALCGSAAVITAQTPATGCVLPAVDVAPPVAQSAPPPPIPVPPVEAPAAGFGVNPIFLALAAVAAGVGLYFLLKKKSSNSPG